MQEGFTDEGEGALGVRLRFAIAGGDGTLVLMKEALAREGGPRDVAGEIA